LERTAEGENYDAPQLTAIADRIERFPGIGAKTALAIRVELGRIALLEAQSS
jgi:Holliday junction resolvasome RuvABC DNA-binding subunit